MEDIRKEPHIRSFLKEGKDAIEVYQILYSLRNRLPLEAYFDLESRDGQVLATHKSPIPDNRGNPVLHYEIDEHSGIIGSTTNSGMMTTDPIVLHWLAVSGMMNKLWDICFITSHRGS